MTVTNLTQGRGVELVPAGYCRLMLQWQTTDGENLEVVFTVTNSESGETVEVASDAHGYAEETVTAGESTITVSGTNVARYSCVKTVTRDLESATTHSVFLLGIDSSFGTGGGGTSLLTAEAELPASGWTDYAQTVAVDGVLADSLVWVTPASTCWDRWGEAGVRCTAQADGSLKFECQVLPTMDFVAEVVVG